MTEKRGTQQGDHSVFRIPPYHYIHVLDQTSNVTRIGKCCNEYRVNRQVNVCRKVIVFSEVK